MGDLLREKFKNLKQDKEENKAVTLYSYKKYSVIYIKGKVEMPDPVGCFVQLDTIYIYNEYRCIASYKPHLDPYVCVKDNIVSLTSDGECWIYDLDQKKELIIPMPSVAFDHSIEDDSEFFCSASASDYEHRDDVFCIEGTGCPWGLESCEVSFNLYIDRNNLKLLKADYLYPDSEEEEED